MGNYNLYVPNKKEWDNFCKKDYYDNRKPDYKIYENALVEPLKKVLVKQSDICYLGGVCSENKEFIAGLERSDVNPRMNMSVFDSYRTSPDNISYLDGEYIFGGVIIHLFGHIITDTLVRLWYVVKNKKENQKIIFVSTTPKIPSSFWMIMEVLGIEKEQIIIADRIYKTKRLIVPEQSFMLYGKYTSEFLSVYRAIGNRLLNSNKESKTYSKKVYLTRTMLSKKDCFNEEYFVNFYKKRGYEIIAPETYPFEEQISILANASEIVSTLGTLTHLALFVPNKVKLTILLRQNEIGAAKQQLMMNSAMDIDYDIVDVSMSLLPTSHAGGVFLIGPTPHWKEYLEKNDIEYSEAELSMDWSCLHDYLLEYTNIYSKNNYPYKRVKNCDMFDVVKRMNYVFNNEVIEREAMQTKSKGEYIKELEKINAEKTIICLNAVKPTKKVPKVVILDKNSEHLGEKGVKKIKGDLVCFSNDGCKISFSDDEYSRLQNSIYDVVFYAQSKLNTSIKEQYINCHGEKSWDIMLSSLKSNAPLYYDASKEIFADKILYCKNSFVMRNDVFKKYAKWILPILNYIRANISQDEEPLLPKIIERLQTLYFIYNKDKYNVGIYN
ncbi:MAG: DUF563 domain-containing protein [Clostridia bacterium]|nr:DUF563 domain-containing protein [Clostridia bacterium]MBQ7789576.1 DUF563 domain-containing protein [Clostridia bacterium]